MHTRTICYAKADSRSEPPSPPPHRTPSTAKGARSPAAAGPLVHLSAGLPAQNALRLAQRVLDGGLEAASVVALYAHGYSLGKVAEELGITKSTAQSHVKNAYRKLGVHSKDELIERLGA